MSEGRAERPDSSSGPIPGQQETADTEVRRLAAIMCRGTVDDDALIEVRSCVDALPGGGTLWDFHVGTHHLAHMRGEADRASTTQAARGPAPPGDSAMMHTPSEASSEHGVGNIPSEMSL